MTRVEGLKEALWRWAVPSLVLFVGISEALTNNTGPWRAFELGVAIALSVPLVFRSRAPIVMFGLVLLAAALQATFSSSSQLAIPIAILIASEAVGRHAEEPASWVAPLTVILIVLGLVVLGDDPFEDLVFGGLVMVGVWFLGRAFRLLATLKSKQQEQATLLIRQAEERETEAVEVERARIARELHDIVGHATSLITIRLQALRRSLPSDDPTADEIKSIEGDARQALSDMRRLVAIMSDTESAGRLEPPPKLDAIPDLVESMRKAGYSVDAEIAKLPDDLNPGVQLAAYRVVQEALTNVIRHSSGSQVEVSIAVDHESLRIDVKDDGQPSPGRHNGTGLVGMRQRVALYDGSVSAGPGPDGGYRVQALLRIPRGSA
jgi:signal transduction histidine kinase